MSHVPVLKEEVLALLAPERGGTFVDATLGFGGHAEAVLDASPDVRLYGVDQDRSVGEATAARLGERLRYLHGNFGDMAYLLKGEGVSAVDGILMDVGVSSWQLDAPERGFSFMHDGPLDMRMDTEGEVTAADIVNRWPEVEIARVLFEYGEERLSRKIARVICERRKKEPFTRTLELAELVAHQYHPAQRYKKPHPATRTFQALRIAVNRELEVLRDGLEDAFSLLAPGGRLVVISFHSLEDRIVKHAFRDKVGEGGFGLLTKKALTASDGEVAMNSRSRSAKVRGIVRTVN